MKSYITDTYAWIAYFEGKPKFKEIIEKNELYTPSIVLAEITRILARKNVPKEKSTRILEFIKERSLILSLDETNAVKAGGSGKEGSTPNRRHSVLACERTYSSVDRG
jgi:predicted nucleic acid-binding protein